MLKKTQNSKLKSQNFLEKIMVLKKKDLVQIIQKTQLIGYSENQRVREPDSSSFLDVFEGKDKNKISLIAEIKFASPTNQSLGSPEELAERAKQYEQAGAKMISIITEKHYFKGDISFISKVKENVSLPVLQKDFIIDPVQIYEAKEAGADALLLISRLVTERQLQKFVSLCFSLGIEPVVEINNEEDLKKTITTKTNIIAVNARDLDTFIVDIEKACLLMQEIPNRFIKLGFSGIHSVEEILQYKKAGAKGVLVGTSLMKANDIKGFIESLQL